MCCSRHHDHDHYNYDDDDNHIHCDIHDDDDDYYDEYHNACVFLPEAWQGRRVLHKGEVRVCRSRHVCWADCAVAVLRYDA